MTILNKKKILYMEDDKMLSDIMKRRLEAKGCEVTVAYDGEVGLQRLKEQHYDILLLDLLMPKIGGFEVLEQLQGSDVLKTTAVFVLSNLGEASDIDRAKSLGISAFFVKALATPDSIAMALGEHFDKS